MWDRGKRRSLRHGGDSRQYGSLFAQRLVALLGQGITELARNCNVDMVGSRVRIAGRTVVPLQLAAGAIVGE